MLNGRVGLLRYRFRVHACHRQACQPAEETAIILDPMPPPDLESTTPPVLEALAEAAEKYQIPGHIFMLPVCRSRTLESTYASFLFCSTPLAFSVHPLQNRADHPISFNDTRHRRITTTGMLITIPLLVSPAPFVSVQAIPINDARWARSNHGARVAVFAPQVRRCLECPWLAAYLTDRTREYHRSLSVNEGVNTEVYALGSSCSFRHS